MENIDYIKLPPEVKKELVKPQVDLFISAVNNRMATLPTISALAATLLVVATFNEKLLPITNLVKVLLSILLILIPVSLYMYNLDLKRTIERVNTNLKRYTGIDLDTKLKTDSIGLVIRHFPDFAIYLIGLIILVLLLILWF